MIPWIQAVSMTGWTNVDWSEWVKRKDRQFSWEFAVTGWRRSGGLGGKQGPERFYLLLFF